MEDLPPKNARAIRSRRGSAAVCGLAGLVVVSVASVGAAQDTSDDDPRLEGRGFTYGAHLISPVYASQPRHVNDPAPLDLGGGLGIRVRLGWELPFGFSVTLQGGLAANALGEHPEEASQAFIRYDAGLGARYHLYVDDSPIVPFVSVAAMMHIFRFDSRSGEEIRDGLGLGLGGGLGARYEVSPFFAIELAVDVNYVLDLGSFNGGFVIVTPKLGVMFYVD